MKIRLSFKHVVHEPHKNSFRNIFMCSEATVFLAITHIKVSKLHRCKWDKYKVTPAHKLNSNWMVAIICNLFFKKKKSKKRSNSNIEYQRESKEIYGIFYALLAFLFKPCISSAKRNFEVIFFFYFVYGEFIIVVNLLDHFFHLVEVKSMRKPFIRCIAF